MSLINKTTNIFQNFPQTYDDKSTSLAGSLISAFDYMRDDISNLQNILNLKNIKKKKI